MKKLFISFLLAALAFEASAQTTFQKMYGGSNDEGMFEIARTFDGGYILAGQTASFSAISNDVYLVKTDEDGNMQWSKVYRGFGTEYAIGIRETADHGFIISGATTSFGGGAEDGFLTKTDASGNIQWSKVFGGPAEDMLFSVIQTFDGGYIAAGHSGSFGAGSMDMMLIRTNALGDTVWTRLIGGADWDNATDIIQASDSSFVLCGRTRSFGSNYLKTLIAKLNPSGDTLWTVQYGGTEEEENQSLEETLDGDYIVLGSSNSFSGSNYNAYLNRFDTTGNLLWSKIYGGLKLEAMYEVVTMADSGFAIVGFTETFGPGHRGSDSANVWLVRTDANGDTLWTRSYGGEQMEEVYGMVKNDNEGLTILAYSSSFTADSLDVYLIVTDSLGNSNCNEEPTNPFVFTPPTVVSRVAPQVSSGITMGAAPFITVNPPTSQNTFCFTVGTSDIEAERDEVILFPNPASNELTVLHPGQFDRIEIFDLPGQMVLSKTKTIIDVSMLSAGIYFVKLYNGSKSVAGKLVISR
jgi:hypothetical protein